MYYYDLYVYVTKTLAVGTLLTHIGLLLFFVLFLFRKHSLLGKWWKTICEFFLDYSITFSFLIPLVAVFSSLFYSEVAKLAPCTLCWWQRVFIYPQAIIWGIAVYRKKAEVIFYTLPLTVIGTIIAASHYVEQMQEIRGQTVFSLIPCSTSELSCSSYYFLEFGYITIPLMSLTAFVVLLLIQIQLYCFKKREATRND